MQRRKYIIGASSLVTAVIAGCSGDSSSATPTQTANTGNHLQAAAEAIQSANDAISTEADKFSDTSVDSGGGIDVQTSMATGYLDTASSELDTAGQGASTSQQETIDAAQNWVSYGRAVIEFLDIFADGYSDFTTALTYMESERYSDSADSFQTAGNTFDDADSQLTIVRDRSESLTETDSEYFSDVDMTSSEADVDQLGSLLDTFSPMADGMRDLVQGLDDFTAATTSLENSQYSDAEESYEAAQSHFTTAESTFIDLESSAPNSIQSSIIEMTCYAGALSDGAEHYAAGSGHYADGDTQAGDDEFEMGEEDLNQCSFEA